MSDTAPDDSRSGRGPRGRGRKLIAPLRLTSAAALLTALLALAMPGRAGTTAGAVMLTLLVAAPLGRIAFLAVRWWQLGDRAYSLRATALLVAIGLGGLVAAVT